MTWLTNSTIWFVLAAAFAAGATTVPAAAQEHRSVVLGHVGAATLGHADSEQGTAAIFGGGIGVHLTPRLVLEGDVHGGRVTHVFGRDHHDFAQITATASLVFRSTPLGRAHFVAGGGLALQRAHTDVDDPPFRIDRVETIRLLHGRIGAEWDLSNRVVMRIESGLWFGEGLDWVAGARVGLGYRF